MKFSPKIPKFLIITPIIFGHVVLLRMNAPNLALYNTRGVGDKGDNPFIEKILLLYNFLF
jgi:hypothetical protein